MSQLDAESNISLLSEEEAGSWPPNNKPRSKRRVQWWKLALFPLGALVMFVIGGLVGFNWKNAVINCIEEVSQPCE